MSTKSRWSAHAWDPTNESTHTLCNSSSSFCFSCSLGESYTLIPILALVIFVSKPQFVHLVTKCNQNLCQFPNLRRVTKKLYLRKVVRKTPIMGCPVMKAEESCKGAKWERQIRGLWEGKWLSCRRPSQVVVRKLPVMRDMMWRRMARYSFIQSCMPATIFTEIQGRS